MTLWVLDGVAPVVHSTACVHPDATVIGRVELGPEMSVWPQAVLRGDYGEIRVWGPDVDRYRDGLPRVG